MIDPAKADTKDRPHVIIVGGGFGGLQAAKRLSRRARVHITVIDRHNYHLFQPLLYQVATAGLGPNNIAAPIRRVLRNREPVEVLLGEVESVDVDNKRVHLTDGAELRYDYLILACGATHSYFGRDDWAPFAPGLKSIDDALLIRRRILLAFERAERATDPEERKNLMRFVIVGGGPTGVELAGAIRELSRFTLAKDFDTIDPAQAQVILLEGGPHILGAFPQELSIKARESLERMGVTVRENTRVTGIDEDGVLVGNERIPAKTVLWAAGVAASPLGKSLGVPLDRAGRVIVNPDLTVPGHEEISIAGDMASLTGPDGHPVPGLAPAAMQMGEHAADNIARMLDGKPPTPFRYKDKGIMATVGRRAAVARVGERKFSGWFAWILWCFIHILFLIGFRNRFRVLTEWAWGYIGYDRGSRLITGPLDFHTVTAPRETVPTEAG